MKKVIITITILFLLVLSISINIRAEDVPVRVDPDKIYKAAKDWAGTPYKLDGDAIGKFQKIDIYGENDSLTEICFICDKGLFIYYYKDSNNNGISHIEPVVHAKIVKYDTINRITYEKWNGKGFFKLWYYETEELSMGAGN